MLGLILIYFLGKYFYDLAKEYEKHTWGFAILGVVTYYIGTIVGGIILMFFLEIMGVDLYNFNETGLGLMALPFGLLATWALYKFLEKRFKDDLVLGNSDDADILDRDMF